MPEFVQHDYHNRPAFSGFLPGIAGVHGIPLWAFYVNRGQGICGFGVESKDGCIGQFYSAVDAYHRVRETGFRTFMRITPEHAAPENGAGSAPVALYEPFQGGDGAAEAVASEFRVGLDTLSLSECHPELGVTTTVAYRTLAQSPIAGLMRTVTIVNSSDRTVHLEVVDGLPFVVPAGVDYAALTENITTAQAWMNASPVAGVGALYRVAATMSDSAEVTAQETVHVVAARSTARGSTETCEVIVDPDLLFAPDQFFDYPVHFAEDGLAGLAYTTQVGAGKRPCAFVGTAATLAPGEEIVIESLYGGGASETVTLDFLRWFDVETNRAALRRATEAIVPEITAVARVQTAHPVFDAYVEQTFLDNALRGGVPHIVQSAAGETTYLPVFGRKHGDLERDYNWFVIPAEYFSQGWGNYRDVNQNRRCDVFFQPESGTETIREFVSLIQTDGYNPLIVQGRTFTVPAADAASLPATSALVANGACTAGALYQAIERDIGPDNASDVATTFAKLITSASVEYNAKHGEGFWIDHWTYNNDLIEHYLAVFPDRAEELFWGEPTYRYPVATHRVRSRRERWTRTPRGVRQYDAVTALDAPQSGRWMRTASGDVYHATLAEKLLGLAAVVFLSRDAFGMGVEMEAGKPGWYDALNGLPGIFGSSLPEAWELLRLICTLRMIALPASPAARIEIAEEISGLLTEIAAILAVDRAADSAISRAAAPDDTALHARWHQMASVRETYRDRTVFGFSGERVSRDTTELGVLLEAMEQDVRRGLTRARERNDGVYPTYLLVAPRESIELDRFLADVEGAVPAFSLTALPPFLEGAARAVPMLPDRAERKALHRWVLESELYDAKIRMLRVNAPLDAMTHEIGRARAFTPGWLENGSIWLHMEYKYLLALLYAELYTEFWEHARTMLIPFIDAERYGRSPWENSSFIVSSAHPDERLHGRGFVARLSGSTAEFLSILTICLWGRRPFRNGEGGLTLAFDPCLPEDLFGNERRILAQFLGHTEVVYTHAGSGDVMPGGPVVVRETTVTYRDATPTEAVTGAALPAAVAIAVREGRVSQLAVTLDTIA